MTKQRNLRRWLVKERDRSKASAPTSEQGQAAARGKWKAFSEVIDWLNDHPSSSCAYGGREALLKANAHMMNGVGEWDALQSWLDGVWGNDGGEIPVCRKQNECFNLPVRILIFALPAGGDATIRAGACGTVIE